LLSLHFSADSPINKFLLTARLQRLPAFLFGGTLREGFEPSVQVLARTTV